MKRDGLTANLPELASAVTSCAREVSFGAQQSIYEVSTFHFVVLPLQLLATRLSCLCPLARCT